MTIRKRITSSIYNTLLDLGLDVRRVKTPRMFLGEPFTYTIGKFELLLPPGHALPKMQERSPEYGHMLIRLAAALQKKDTQFVVVDIGANVGDSTAFIKTGAPKSVVFCVEGFPPYLEYLMRNSIQWPDVLVFTTFMSDVKGMLRAEVEENQGTIRLLPKGKELSASVTTLDAFVHEHTQAREARLIKIDTDGYDIRVLQGGMRLIKSRHPVLFFEYQKIYWPNPQDGMKILKRLRSVGYRDILFYDCFGELLLATTLDDTNTIAALDSYITRGEPAITYYDVCLFHSKDSSIAKQFITSEHAHYEKARRTANY